MCLFRPKMFSASKIKKPQIVASFIKVAVSVALLTGRNWVINVKQTPLTPSWLWVSVKYLYHPQKSGRRLNCGTCKTGRFLLLRTRFFRLAVASAFMLSDTAGTERGESDLNEECAGARILQVMSEDWIEMFPFVECIRCVFFILRQTFIYVLTELYFIRNIV